MRRDVCHFYPTDTVKVYNAYLRAIKEKFNSDCTENAYHTISFGLKFSFKYNMNSGSCTVHLMPYKNGTAVDIKYSIVQAFGARYEAHDRDLTNYVQNILSVYASNLQISVEEFCKEENQLLPENVTKNLSEATTPATSKILSKFCPNCGSPFGERDRFCGKCGTKRV